MSFEENWNFRSHSCVCVFFPPKIWYYTIPWRVCPLCRVFVFSYLLFFTISTIGSIGKLWYHLVSYNIIWCHMILRRVSYDTIPWRDCPPCCVFFLLLLFGFYHLDDLDSIRRQAGHEGNRVRGVRRHLRREGGGGPPQRLQRLRPVSHRALLPGKLNPYRTGVLFWGQIT